MPAPERGAGEGGDCQDGPNVAKQVQDLMAEVKRLQNDVKQLKEAKGLAVEHSLLMPGQLSEAVASTVHDEPSSKVDEMKLPRAEDSEVVQAGEHEWDVALEASIWDVGLLLFVEGGEVFTMCEKVVGWFLVVLNDVLQIVFINAVFGTMSRYPYDKVTQRVMLSKRLQENHDLSNIDAAGLRTRTALLCDSQIHNKLVDTYSAISTYLQMSEYGGGHGVPGFAICLIAMLIWALSMMREIRRSWLLFQAVVSLETVGHNAKYSITLGDDGIAGGIVTKLSVMGKIITCCTVIIPRVGIAVSLLVGGQFFLSTSTTVTDLVLNACALEIVKDLDELLFEAIMSSHADAVMQGTVLRPNHDNRRYGWLLPEVPELRTKKAFIASQVSIFARLFMAMVFVIAGYFLFLKETVKETEKAAEMTCGRDQDFAYSPHPFGGLPFFSEVSPEKRTVFGLMCYYDAQSQMLQLRAGFEPDEELFPGLNNATLSELLKGTHPTCQDRSLSPPQQDPTKLNCPQYSLTEMEDMVALGESGLLQDANRCEDQDVSFIFLRSVCLSNKTYAERTPMIQLFEDKFRCSDVQKLCCHSNKIGAPKCTPSDIPVVNGVKLEYNLASKVTNMCPRTCGLCPETGQQAGQGEQQAIQGGAEANQTVQGGP
eukprot:TRINITY_DN31440_c0_g1_i1.p1 TRINITY_DN31440_c0_g1~~TRINITY_DN31440_c0_g1_i1.p1  ORF type:complete len:672 (-),score=114.61 TRINITY_DN31440_c0_g1_i1:135-2096(-)